MPRIRRSLLLSLAIATLLAGPPLFAAELNLSSGPGQATLIELFTSQGCSSCPPAERWLGSLQNDPRLWKELVPVAFHVDYWNYLGWDDPLSRPAFSARQRRYRSEGAISAVYTPGFVVNGTEWRRWLGLNQLPPASRSGGKLTLNLNHGNVTARYTPARAVKGTLTLNLAILGVGLRSVITSGENAGKTLPQDFVVLKYLQHHSNDGQWHLTLPPQKTPAGVRLALAAWVNNSEQQAPLQAVGGWLPAEGQ